MTGKRRRFTCWRMSFSANRVHFAGTCASQDLAAGCPAGCLILVPLAPGQAAVQPDGWLGAARWHATGKDPQFPAHVAGAAFEIGPMPVINRVSELQPDIMAWRRDLHAHPEVLYDVHWTAAYVADRLREFGCDEVVTGMGQTGVVGVIKGRKPAADGAKAIGLRADM